MTITEYINNLVALKATYGDVEVVEADSTTTLGAIKTAKAPEVVEEAILNGREKNRRKVLLFDSLMVKSGKKFVYVGR